MNRMPPAVEMDVVVGSKAEGARRATGAFEPTATSAATAPDPEVPAKAQRRRFTAAYRLRILKQADACKRPGDLGALLRREGLYSSHLANWRRQREQGALRDMRGRRRGPTPRPIDPRVKQCVALRRQVASSLPVYTRSRALGVLVFGNVDPPRRRVCRDRGPVRICGPCVICGAQAGGGPATAAPGHAPVRGGRAPLRGAASHEVEGGGGTDRVGPPTGWHRLRQIGDQLVSGVEQFLLINNVGPSGISVGRKEPG